MNELERNVQAAKRCAELTNSLKEKHEVEVRPQVFLHGDASGIVKALYCTTLNLDDLARKTLELVKDPNHTNYDEAEKLAKAFMLPEPPLTPMQRLAKEYGISTEDLELRLKGLGLTLVEAKANGDD